MDYYDKYIKYKLKYIKLRDLNLIQLGGANIIEYLNEKYKTFLTLYNQKSIPLEVDSRIPDFGHMSRFIYTHESFIEIFKNYLKTFARYNRTSEINRNIFTPSLKLEYLYMGLYSIFTLLNMPKEVNYNYDKCSEYLHLLINIYKKTDNGLKNIVLVDGLNIIRNKSIMLANLFLFQDNQVIFTKMKNIIDGTNNYIDDYYLLQYALPIILNNYFRNINVLVILPNESINDYVLNIGKIEPSIVLTPKDNLFTFIYIPKFINKQKVKECKSEVDDVFIVILFNIIIRFIASEKANQRVYIFSGDKYKWYNDENVRLNRCCLLINSSVLNTVRTFTYSAYFTETGQFIIPNYRKDDNGRYINFNLCKPQNLILLGIKLIDNIEVDSVQTELLNFYLTFNLKSNTVCYNYENLFIKQYLKVHNKLPIEYIHSRILTSNPSTESYQSMVFIYNTALVDTDEIHRLDRWKEEKKPYKLITEFLKSLDIYQQYDKLEFLIQLIIESENNEFSRLQQIENTEIKRLNIKLSHKNRLFPRSLRGIPPR